MLDAGPSPVNQIAHSGSSIHTSGECSWMHGEKPGPAMRIRWKPGRRSGTMQRPAGDIRPPEAGAASGERVWMNRWRSWRLAAIYREETRTGPGGWILRDSRRVDAQ